MKKIKSILPFLGIAALTIALMACSKKEEVLTTSNPANTDTYANKAWYTSPQFPSGIAPVEAKSIEELSELLKSQDEPQAGFFIQKSGDNPSALKSRNEIMVNNGECRLYIEDFVYGYRATIRMQYGSLGNNIDVDLKEFWPMELDEYNSPYRAIHLEPKHMYAYWSDNNRTLNYNILYEVTVITANLQELTWPVSWNGSFPI